MIKVYFLQNRAASLLHERWKPSEARSISLRLDGYTSTVIVKDFICRTEQSSIDRRIKMYMGRLPRIKDRN